jgi:hypothetical protein
MKHIQTFENYIISLNEADTFKEGDFVKWITPQTGTQISFGIVTKVYSNSFDAKTIATGGKGDEQPNRGLSIGLGGPVLWNPRITAKKLKQDIEDLGGSTNMADKIKFDKASIWNINESQVNESNATLGTKAKQFANAVKGLVDTFIEAEKKEEDKLPDEYTAALKTLGINKQDAAICFFDSVGDADDVLDAAKKAGIKYAEVNDSETGSGAIVFSTKQ